MSLERSNVRTVGVIPARWSSSRLPGKALLEICGKPLVQWVYEGCRRAASLDDLLVATDDRRIAAAVAGFGGQAVLTDSGHPSGTDRVAEALAARPADLVVNIQGDEPLIEPELIDQLVAMARRTGWDMVTAAAPLPDPAEAAKPSICKVVMRGDGRALYFSRQPIPAVRDAGRQFDEPLYWRHIGIYLYRRPFLERLVREPPCLLEQAECLEQLRALHIG
ncbi:MAG: 3-deoxy-manno-octulosonate cytidylyltransferase, partial [Kiritimatiellia bacterium]